MGNRLEFRDVPKPETAPAKPPDEMDPYRAIAAITQVYEDRIRAARSRFDSSLCLARNKPDAQARFDTARAQLVAEIASAEADRDAALPNP
jgi:hypothetical protein